MMKEHEPDSGFNLPPGCHEIPEPDERICATCRHCMEGCCDYGVCERRLYAREPKDFDSWAAVLDYLDAHRVDMQQDVCSNWEEWK